MWQISDGIKEQTNIVSSKVPWLHTLSRRFLVPVGFVPTNKFNRINSGIMMKSKTGKVFISI